MTRSRDISPRRILAFMAMLLAAMFTTLLLPAYGQQEVSPDWFDPYAVHSPVPDTAAVHSAQPSLALHRYQPAFKSVPSAQGAEKLRGKRPTAASRIPAVGVLRDPEQEAKVRQSSVDPIRRD